MDTPSFKPSEVFLITFPPLVGTMGKAEVEAAASMLVRVCQVDGNEWKPCSPQEVGLTLKADIDNKVEPWTSLNRNPFFRPDFHELVALGFARFTTEDEHAPIEFTEQGLEAMRRWVRPAS
jgi:hypothetical protein